MTRQNSYSVTSKPRVAKTFPLLDMLTHEASQRGDSLQTLARKLGVTYRRLAQWKSNNASIASAHGPVFTAAAAYLQLPRIIVMACAGVISLEDIERPSHLAQDVRLHRELEAMKQDPCVAPFVPSSLAEAPLDVRLFVTFLYKEAKGANTGEHSLWLSDVLATVAMAQHRRHTLS
jgi:hypothetical protein